jgi:hypothetical protein
MTCQDLERRLADSIENQLAASADSEIEAHLAECESCRQFSGHIGELDGLLSRQLKVPVLPEGFEERVRLRIRTRTTPLSEADRAERKRSLQREFEQRMAWLGSTPLNATSFVTTSLLTGLAYAALATAAGLLVWFFIPVTAEWLGHHGLGGANRLFPLVIIAASVLSLAGGVAVFQDRLLRRWSAVLP